MFSDRRFCFEIKKRFICSSLGNHLSSHSTLADSREYLGQSPAFDFDYDGSARTERVLRDFSFKLFIAQSQLLSEYAELSLSHAFGKIDHQSSGTFRDDLPAFQ